MFIFCVFFPKKHVSALFSILYDWAKGGGEGGEEKEKQ